jgi:hypothetical protein
MGGLGREQQTPADTVSSMSSSGGDVLQWWKENGL